MAGLIEVEIRSYFAPLVVTLDLPKAGKINRALKTMILKHEQLTQGVTHSNLGGWQSAADILAWDGGPDAQLSGHSREISSKLTADRPGAAGSLDREINAWANINRGCHANEFPSHPDRYWSPSYNVDDSYGSGGGREAAGGKFEIQDPRGVAPAMYAPLLALALPGDQSVGANELIPPKAERLMILPAWLSHGVWPSTGTGVRISVALNFSL